VELSGINRPALEAATRPCRFQKKPHAVSGMAIINYQCLVPLPRIMAPLLARDNARRGRSGKNWAYESLYGRTAVLFANVFVIVIMGWNFLG
jgi:hypothetical protein